MGWNDLSVTRPSALVDGLDGRGRLLRAQLRGRAESTTASSSPPPITTAASSPPSSTEPSPASSSTPSAARLQALASSRTRWHGQEARDPLPRRRGRTRRQGRELRRPPRDGRADRARDPLLGARRRRARLPRHHGHARGPRADPRADRAGRGGADDPVHGRRRRHGPRRCAVAAPCRRRQGRGQSSRLRRPVDPHRARRRVRLAGRRLRDRRQGRRGRHPRRQARRAAATPSTGRSRRSSAAPASCSSRRSTPTARGPATTCRSRARSPRRSRCR